MEMRALVLLLFALTAATVDCNSEGDALYTQRRALEDPNKVLQSWNPALVNPCTWFHVTCDSNNQVIRVDLGKVGLSGPLVPELGHLTHLQYLQFGGNRLTGSVPPAIGNLTNLVSLGLENNRLSGAIPATLGNLRSLRFLSLQGNQLSGSIPRTIFDLVAVGNLRLMNVSDNQLAGTIRSSNKTGFAITTVIQDRRAPAKD